jgi:hypothetical protein
VKDMNAKLEFNQFLAKERIVTQFREAEVDRQAKTAVQETIMKRERLVFIGLLVVLALAAAALVLATRFNELAQARPAAAQIQQAEAADAHAARWIAMGKAYERMGLLNFDYNRATAAHAARWVAMSKAYERMGLLNFDYDAAAEAQASRWNAMADFYARHDLLNEPSNQSH